MKKLLFSLLLISLLTISCLPILPTAQAPVPDNQPPVAYIDLVSASQIAPGGKVTFTGHGLDPDSNGSIVAYSWRSSIDGNLSAAATFSTTSLTEGTHTIWFKVQDNQGSWSNEVPSNVNVIPPWAIPPTIKSFEANPAEIIIGQPATLNWNVTNAATAKIDPDIGNVALTGNRTVSPIKNTIYTLTATNQGGSVTATTGVAILTVPVHTVELYPIATESGHVRYDGYVGPEPNVGDFVVAHTHTAVPMEAFLSFDVSMIPQGAKVKSVSFDLAAGNMYGDPFTLLGSLYIYACSYDKLRSSNFVEGTLGGPIYNTGRMPAGPVSSTLMTESVQAVVDSRNPRFQIRLQFEKCSCRVSQSEAGYIALGGTGSKLIVKYQD